MFRCLAFLFALAATSAEAGTVTVAVASNFTGPAREIADRFEIETGHDVRIVTGSTGKLYAQILAGAPFDVFLSADEEAPAKLLGSGLATGVSRYALGVLVIVSADPALRGEPCRDALERAKGDTVAIANPVTAPYGQAAKAFLNTFGENAELRVVHGDNVAQAMHFVVSGGARFGLVGTGQFHAVREAWPGCSARLEGRDARFIPQAGVLLERAAGDGAAEAFYAFLFSAAARDVIAGSGYGAHFLHRTGHGMGIEVHEHPYITAGSDAVLDVGMVFSIEPGIYLPGRFGVRLEEIVILRADGPEILSDLPRDAVIVDG